jgi:hypothetical protein
MAYQGHKNWDHWNVALWIGNDEGLYLAAKECIAGGTSKTESAEMFLDWLHTTGVNKTPDGAQYTLENVTAAFEGLED